MSVFIQRTLLFLLCGALSFTCFAQDALFLTNSSSLYVASGETLYVGGGVNASLGSSIQNNGEIHLINNSIANESPWTDGTAAGVLGSSTGIVFLEANHQITNGRFVNVYVNTLGTVQLLSDLDITDFLTLQQGVISTGIYTVNITSSMSSALIAGPGNTNFSLGFIDGFLQRAITSNTESYTFPVSKQSAIESNPITFVNNNLQGTTALKVNLIGKQGNDTGLSLSELGATYTSVNDFGTWNIQENVTPIGGSFTLNASIAGFTGLIDDSFALIMRPIGSTDASQWVVPSGSSLPAANTTGRIVLDGVAIRQNISSFGQFGVGSTDAPLPLILISFGGIRSRGGNLLTWRVASEYDVDYYSLQKAWNDGIDFNEIGRIKAKNRNTINLTTYSQLDSLALPGKNYYRLKMVDLDGTTIFSNVILIRNEKPNEYVSIFPNPARNSVNVLSMTEDPGSYVKLSLQNMLGQIVQEKIIENAEAYFKVTLDLNSLPSGHYLVKVCDAQERCHTEKLIKD